MVLSWCSAGARVITRGLLPRSPSRCALLQPCSLDVFGFSDHVLEGGKHVALLQQPGRGAKAGETHELLRIVAAHRIEHVSHHTLQIVVGRGQGLDEPHAQRRLIWEIEVRVEARRLACRPIRVFRVELGFQKLRREDVPLERLSGGGVVLGDALEDHRR